MTKANIPPIGQVKHSSSFMGTKGTAFWEDTLQADYCNCIISSLVSIAQVSIGCYSRVHSIALQSVEESQQRKEEQEKRMKGC